MAYKKVMVCYSFSKNSKIINCGKRIVLVILNTSLKITILCKTLKHKNFKAAGKKNNNNNKFNNKLN